MSAFVEYGWTILAREWEGGVEQVSWLLTASDGVHIRTARGTTPVVPAIKDADEPTIIAFLETSPRVNYQAYRANLAGHLAAAEGSPPDV